MRTLPILPLLSLLACAPANYLYAFDLTDPGAQNFPDFRRPDALEDADLRLEVRADPGEFRAVALDVANKTDGQVSVGWGGIVLVAPDGAQTALRPGSAPYAIEPGEKASVVLTPFELPTQGPAAAALDGATFVLNVPVVVRGTSRVVHLHLQARLTKL